jgi:hypothetical protein
MPAAGGTLASVPPFFCRIRSGFGLTPEANQARFGRSGASGTFAIVQLLQVKNFGFVFWPIFGYFNDARRSLIEE